MGALFASGRVIDLILGVVVLELLGLVWLRRRTRRGLPLFTVAGQLSAGVFLLLAVRCALTGAWWGWTALFLTASLPAHLGDLWLRWRTARP